MCNTNPTKKIVIHVIYFYFRFFNMEFICKSENKLKQIAIFNLFCRITEKNVENRIFGYVIVKLELHSFFFQSNRKRIFFAIKYRISTINRLWMYIKMFNRVKYVTMQHDYCLKLCKWTNIFAYSFVRIHDFFLCQVSLLWDILTLFLVIYSNFK